MGNRRPGFLTRYAKTREISVRQADYQLRKCGIVPTAFFDFEEADRRRRDWLLGPEAAETGNGSSVDGYGPLAVAQAKEKYYKAELAQLAYQERIGQLVEREQVEAEAFRVGRLVRDSLLNVPARLAGILAAETDQRRVHDLLEQELRQALEALAGAGDTVTA